MPSLIPGYQYDIFISYRQKDNQYDGWVSEFVANLKKELDATFKDPVSIYFDENPHDGLLETHEVQASLADKLKAVIFLPILSQTYCDPRSFAWTHEFLAFRKFAATDSLGPSLKLRSGNVANRVLPVRIHELDEVDRGLFEREMGGPLRAVDFVFRGAGINRPLRVRDDELSAPGARALYRDQVNKVANAIKDLLSAAAKSPEPTESQGGRPVDVFPRRRVRPLWIGLVLLIATLISAYWWLTEDKSSKEIGIAVLAFEDHSPGKDKEWLADELAVHLIHSFTFVKGMFVTGKASSFYFKDNPKDPGEIGRMLGVDYILTGSVLVEENNDFVTVQSSLSRISDGRQIWSERFKRSEKSLQEIQNEIVDEVVSIVPGLLLQDTRYEEMPDEVRELLMLGLYHESRMEYKAAREAFDKVLKLDSLCADALLGMGITYLDPAFGDSSLSLLEGYCQLALQADPGNIRARSFAAWLRFSKDCDFQDAMIQLDKLGHEYPHRVEIMEARGVLKYIQGDYSSQITIGERMKKLDPYNSMGYINCGMALINLGRLEEAKSTLRKAFELTPSNGGLLLELGEISLLQGRAKEALQYWQDPRCPWCSVLTPMALVATGDITRAKAVLDSVITSSPSFYEANIAAAFAHLGEKEKCYQWLRKAVTDDCFSLAMIAEHPLYFGPVMNDPTYREIVNSLRISPP